MTSDTVIGGLFTTTRTGDWLIGLVLFFVFLALLRWSNAGKTIAWILALAFALRFLVGISIYTYLPIYGHDNSEDDKAGYVFTDAHNRDDQSWDLAISDRPITDAFTRKFAYDQYGGLLAFSAFIYRYLSPDSHRPLLLILLSAFIAAMGVPFMWKGVSRVFDEKVALASVLIFGFYPESILLGSSAMREPYLLTFSAFVLWGFVSWFYSSSGERNGWIWLALGLIGMILVSPSVAVFTLLILAGWMFFENRGRELSWRTILIFMVILLIGLFFLSTSLNRSGEFDASSPLSVVNDWLRLAVKWNAYQIERESGWVQKLFDEMPDWMRLPFVAAYGILQPVLPAALIVPTRPIWKAIYILRSLGWYVLLPVLTLSFGAASGWEAGRKRSLILWLSFLTWTWILLASLRGGGDSWDNPRYRIILLLWEAVLGGIVWVWWKETRSKWFMRAIGCEVMFLLVFTQWYASRYFHWGVQLPFAAMVMLIAGLWGVILGGGWWMDKKRA